MTVVKSTVQVKTKLYKKMFIFYVIFQGSQLKIFPVGKLFSFEVKVSFFKLSKTIFAKKCIF